MVCIGLLLVLQPSTPGSKSFLRQDILKVATSSGLALNSRISLPSAAIIDTMWHHALLPAYGFC